MTLDDWDQFNARLYTCTSKLSRLPVNTRLDCQRMSDNVSNLLRVADQERVNCRRQNRVTGRYLELMQQAQVALKSLEGHVIIATLMRTDQ